ncbi:unnamed protein product [Durusdinium trenchii]|uniref:Patatin-like phospholipase domain-containing protein An01g04180 n=3 Tax=Durusdinium trenchii TaxID=1381693 RepID=A0ABP0ICB2_9DINO
MIQYSGSAPTGPTAALLGLALLPLLVLELAFYAILSLALLLYFAYPGHREKISQKAPAANETLDRLRAARQSGDPSRLSKLLQEVLTPDLAGALGDEALGDGAEELVDEVCDTLQACSISSKVTRSLRASFGESCLFLSGGGMLGMYHIGTVRRLLQEGLLPNQICGTSVGSIVGAFVATRTDDELHLELDSLEEWYRQMGPVQGPFPVQYWEVVVRVLWRGYIYDYMNQYRNQATFVSAGLTFAEAYARTGRTFTITCAPVTGGPVVLLNRHTSPNVLIASAICASSSMPMLVEAVRLLEKMPDGSVQLVSNCDGNPMGELMRDGTMLADSPCDQLEHMLNVRWSIISQVNPHVVPFSLPFVLAKRIGQFSSVYARILTRAEGQLRRFIWSTLHAFQAWTSFPKQGSWISQLLFQDYFGNVNIIHYNMRFRDDLRLIKNETSLEDFRKKAVAGAACTDEQLPRQRLRHKLEATLGSLEEATSNVRKTRPRRVAGRRGRA